MSIKKIRLFFIEVGGPLVFWFFGILITSSLLVFKLGSLTNNLLSKPEIASYQASTSLNNIFNNPLNAPYKLLVYVLNHFGHMQAFKLRLVSALIGLVTIWLFYYVVSRWHDRRTAIMGTLLFITSAWFLHFARLATPEISSTLLLTALAYGYWIRKTKRSAAVGILGIIIAVCLIYTPGLIWFVIIGGIWQSRQVGSHLKDSKLSVPLIILLAVVLLAPLVIAIARQPLLIKPLVGLPSKLPDIQNILKQILDVPMQIFFRGPSDPVRWLGRLPLLDIFAAAMCLLGIYTYYQHIRLDRSKLLVSIIIVGSILVGLRGSVSIILLAPFIYLLISAGIALLLNQWLRVFPRNPLARITGISLISLAIFLACFYNLRQYFVAWPGAPATKQVYQQRI